jgi:hypothetical protein
MTEDILPYIADPRDGRPRPDYVPPAEAAEIKRAEVNGAPVTEQSHEYVLKKKPAPDAED